MQSSSASTTTTPSSKVKRLAATTEWSELKIDDKHWLPLHVNVDSVAAVIRNLGLRHVNVSENPRLFDLVNDNKVIGFVCCSTTPINLGQLKDYRKQWSFIPVRIENSMLTIQILNLCAVNGKHRDVIYGYRLEKYIKDSSSKGNCSLFNFVCAITPISFAHNISARDFPTSEKHAQQVYVFTKLADMIVFINSNGQLQSFAHSHKTSAEFVKFARRELQCQVFTITEDPFKELHGQLETTKAELEKLNKAELQGEPYNCHLDESLSYKNLKELSILSEQIEDAESFELLIDYGKSTTSSDDNQNQKVKNSKVIQIHQLEKRIRQSVKQIEDTQKIYPHIYWPHIKDTDLYGSKEYLKFYAHYKKTVHIATPRRIKSYNFAPIKASKVGNVSGRRKRPASPPSSMAGSDEMLGEGLATPKRRRSSKVLKTT